MYFFSNSLYPTNCLSSCDFKGLTFKPGTTLKKTLFKDDGTLTTSLIENLI